MTYDISKSISQGSSGTKDAENHRIEEITNELRRCSQLHEKELGVGEGDVNYTNEETPESLFVAKYICMSERVI